MNISKIVSEYDQEIPQSQTADNPVAPRGRAAQPLNLLLILTFYYKRLKYKKNIFNLEIKTVLAAARSKTVVLLLLTFCLLLLLLWESVIVLCFVVRYFMSILVLQSS